VKTRYLAASTAILLVGVASACSTASSGGPGDAGDASDEFATCSGACEAGTTCQGYSVEGYCADYYCSQGAWVLAMGCPAGMSQTPSLTTSCAPGCFGISICPFNNIPPATDVCCCPETDAPAD
jgi:hypothetical protein